MSQKRLTIVIPTYNRSQCLRMLLATLVKEIVGLDDRVGILVSDNGSTDSTQEVTSEFVQRLPGMRIIRHAENVGPDENFCGCVETDDADYFWLIGDDDLPRAGAVRRVLELLDKEEPDLVYLASDWHATLNDNLPDAPVRLDNAVELERLAFARRVNIWTTFISGMVVRRATFVGTASAADLRRYNNTHLIQLAWILGTLERGSKLVYVPEPCVLATSGNTGGYSVLKVFAENFPSIVKQQFGSTSPIARAIIRRSALGYLPALVWNVRVGRAGNFTKAQSSGQVVQRQRAGALGFWIVKIIDGWPRTLALAVRLGCTVLARTLRIHDMALESLGGRKRRVG